MTASCYPIYTFMVGHEERSTRGKNAAKRPSTAITVKNQAQFCLVLCFFYGKANFKRFSPSIRMLREQPRFIRTKPSPPGPYFEPGSNASFP
ncbi:hypothetical protein SRABI96_03253 [Peribacillus sp. Bi96]|nr:hypothetical protein SRABI96_03253 [Peribacillus sp. Bi96]